MSGSVSVSSGSLSDASGGGDRHFWRLAGLLIAVLAVAALTLPAFASAGPRLDLNAAQAPAGDLKNGETATFTASITNTGNAPSLPTATGDPIAAINALGIQFQVPAGTTVVDYGSEDQSYWNGFLGNGCQYMELLGSRIFICLAPAETTLDPNESTPDVWVKLRVDGDATGTIIPTWNGQQTPVSGPSWYPFLPVPFDVIPNPAFDLDTTPQDSLIKRGSTAQLDLDLTNEGPAPSAGQVTITDTLPEGLTLDSASSPGNYWSCSGSSEVTCTSNAAIAAGASAPTLTLAANVGASAADTATNVATAGGGGVVADAESSTDLPIFGAGTEPVRLIFDQSAGATADGDSGSFIRIHKAGEPNLIDFSKAEGQIILNGGVDGDEVRIPQGSIDLPKVIQPNFDLGIPLSMALNMHIGMTATDDWGGTIDASGNAELAMPMKFDYTLIPGAIPIDAFKCESGPVDLGNLTTGHSDATNTLPPDPVTDGSPFSDGNGTVIDNTFTVGAAQPCSVNPLVALVVPGVNSPIITALINSALGTTGGSKAGNADAQIQLHRVDPADPVLSPETTVPAGSELYIDEEQVGGGTFRLNVTNAGGSATDGSDLTLTDVLPAGTSYDSFTSTDPNWSCSASEQTVTCVLTGTTLNPGDVSNPVDITVTTDRFAWPTVVNELAATGGGATGIAHAVQHADLVVHGPQLGLTVSNPGDGFTVGQQFAKVNVQVENLSQTSTGGQDTSGQVYVSGHLPPGVTFDESAGAPTPWICDPEEPDADGQDIGCFFFATGPNALDPGPFGRTETLALPVEISQEAGASVVTTWSATGGGAPQITDPNDVSLAIDVVRPELKLGIAAEGNFRNGGSGGSFVISLENAGDGGTSPEEVKITDTLPIGLTPVGTSSEGGYWNCAINGQRVACDNGGDHIEAGESVPDLTVAVAVEDPPVPVLTNTAVASGGASPHASASVTLNTAGPMLSVASAHSGDFTTGENGIYRLLVSNDGDADTDGSEVTLTDTLPEGLAFAAANSAGDYWSCAAAGQVVTCTGDETIEARSKAPVLRLSTSVGKAALPGVTNVVRVTGGGALPASHADPTNVVKAQVKVTRPRVGRVAVRPKVRRMRPGQTKVFRVRVTNSGNGVGRKAKVCLKAAKRFVAVRGKNCRNLGQLRPGQTKARKFRVRLKGAARNLKRRALPVKVRARIPKAKGAKVRKANARIKLVK